MDPLSITASVAGIVSLGLQITKTLSNFYSTYKGQKREVAEIVKSLEFVLRNLDTTRGRVERRHATSKETDLLDEINGLLQDCNKSLRELRADYERFYGNGKLSYPYHRRKLQRREEDVHDILSQLKLALHHLLHDDVEELLQMIRANHSSQNVIDWLNAPDATVNFNEIHKKRHRDTGLWFVKGLEFTTWLTKPNSFLWLHGFAGCGKSVLSSTAIQSTFQHRQSIPGPRTGIAFFFFTFNDNSKQDASGMLRALILQLSGQLDDDHQILSQIYESHGKSSPSIATLRNCFRQLVERSNTTYVVLDALDESPLDKDRRKDVLDEVVEIRKWPTVHLLVTSRDEPDIRDVFGHTFHPFPNEMICLKNSHVDADITSFISASLNEDPRLRRFSDKYRDQIEQALTTGAKGVFRWAECQLISLRTCPTSQKKVKELLASLPKSLDETYERILVEIDKLGFADDARRLLTILAYVRRPLCVKELFEAMAVDIGDCPRFDSEARFEDEEDIHRICPGLIEIYPPETEYEQPTVHIAHFSVQEYLESGRIRRSRAETFAISSGHAHGEMAAICLAYIQDPNVPVPSDHWPLSFYHYSHQQWVVHAYLASPKPAPVTSIISSSSPIATGFLLQKPEWHNDTEDAASIHWLLENGVEIEVQDASWERSPLHCAALNKCPECCRILLKRGATISTDNAGMTPFHYAIEKGNESVAQVFLDAGQPVDVRARSRACRKSSSDEKGPTALHFAALFGSKKMTKYLLDHKADPNAALETGETPLHMTLSRRICWAPGRRQYTSWDNNDCQVESIFQYMEREPDEPGYQEDLEEFKAIVRDARLATLELLLNHPHINIDATDIQGKAPIHAAIDKSHLDEIKFLVQRGANLLHGDHDGLNALHYAAKKGEMDIITFLLSSIPDPELLNAFCIAKDNRKRNALHYAAEKGTVDMIAFLLCSISNPKLSNTFCIAKDNQGRNALHYALMSRKGGDFEVIQYLLTKTEIGINDEDKNGMTPLATYFDPRNFFSCELEIVRLLLGRGSDPSFTTRDGGLGLAHLYAATYRIRQSMDVETLRTMAKYSVDLKMRDGQGRTVLHHSAISGSLDEDTLSFLCSDEVGLSTDTTDACGKTALDYLILEAEKPRHSNLFKPGRWSRAEKMMFAFIALRNQPK